MVKDTNGFTDKLLATFRAESEEHLRAMSSDLEELERGAAPPAQAGLVERMFRDAHSLKGASRAVNRRDIEAVCRGLESAFAALKSGRASVTPALCESLRQALDAIAGMQEAGAASPGVPSALAPLLRRLEGLDGGPAPGGAHPRPRAAPAADEAAVAAPAGRVAGGTGGTSVRVGTARLDAVMRGAEGLLAARIAAGRRVKEIREVGAAVAAWRREVAATQARPLPIAADVQKQLARIAHAAERDERSLAAATGALLREVREMQLLPVATLLEGFPRTVRDLAREQGKQVETAIVGDEIEIDRRILQELREPLLHVVRNCVDHGIEASSERQSAGKPPHGRISFAVTQADGGRFVIAVEDDGRGIDVAKVVGRAAEMGMAIPGQGAPARDSLELVFRSGVSTSTMLTDVSGHGLGLAIVREKVEKLDGRVEIDSQPGRGTRLRLVLPHSLATYRGVVVRAAERSFLVPTAAVARVSRARRTEIHTVEGRDTIALDGRVLALVRLSDVLGVGQGTNRGTADTHLRVVVLGHGKEGIAFEVDEVTGEQEVLVRTLGPQLPRVRNVAGACVIASGELIPVLSAPDLLRSAAAAPAAAAAAADHRVTSGERDDVLRPASILVVEDSITSRALLQNILESAGYRVSTAVDGLDALARLRAGEFDLVVSDVEMPRLDGFGLTARIRADRRLAELPVVLVTALGSREHRERGIEAGANAYLVKSDFEQGNLLDTLRRLI